jgi:hypothetical protein
LVTSDIVDGAPSGIDLLNFFAVVEVGKLNLSEYGVTKGLPLPVAGSREGLVVAYLSSLVCPRASLPSFPLTLSSRSSEIVRWIGRCVLWFGHGRAVMKGDG